MKDIPDDLLARYDDVAVAVRTALRRGDHLLDIAHKLEREDYETLVGLAALGLVLRAEGNAQPLT